MGLFPGWRCARDDTSHVVGRIRSFLRCPKQACVVFFNSVCFEQYESVSVRHRWRSGAGDGAKPREPLGVQCLDGPTAVVGRSFTAAGGSGPCAAPGNPRGECAVAPRGAPIRSTIPIAKTYAILRTSVNRRPLGGASLLQD